jgi:hypothetical protein
MKNYDKSTIIPKEEWRATAKAANPFIKSYHISPLYNPPGMYSWEDMVFDWIECWDLEHNRLKDKEKYRTFRNTKQGLPFVETGTQIKYERTLLYKRTGFARGHVPNKMALKNSGSIILIVIASVDVQKDRLYVDVKGYSNRGVTWTLDFDELENYLADKRFISDDGHVYKISQTIVDSGWNTDYVYAFASRYSSGIYACKGADYLRGGETYKYFDKGTLDRINLRRASPYQSDSLSRLSIDSDTQDEFVRSIPVFRAFQALRISPVHISKDDSLLYRYTENPSVRLSPRNRLSGNNTNHHLLSSL